MNEDLIAGHFVRSACRLPTPIEGSISNTAKMQYNSASAVMEADDIYSHFELDQGGDLLCIFSTQDGLLLGETVRDWIGEIHGETLNFLWCEKLGNDYAIICVLDGRVVKESFEDQFSIVSQFQLLVKRVQNHGEDFKIFLCNLERDDLDLSSEIKFVMLEDSVLKHVKEMSSRTLPQLHAYSKALSKVTRSQVLARILIVGIASLIAVIPATWYGAHFWFGEMPEVSVDDFEDIRNQNKEYSELLMRSDAGQLLQEIYRVSQKIANSPAVRETWYISEILWVYGENLQVRVYIPKLTDALGGTISTPPESRQRLQEEANTSGWTVQFFPTSALIAAPVPMEPRSPLEADRLRLHEPSLKTDRWHPKRLALTMDAVGELNIDENTSSGKSQYYFRSAVFSFSKDPWLNGETPAWLTQTLAGGPLLLDSIALHTSDGSRGGLMDGRIKFRMLWRVQ